MSVLQFSSRRSKNYTAGENRKTCQINSISPLYYIDRIFYRKKKIYICMACKDHSSRTRKVFTEDEIQKEKQTSSL